MSDISIYFGFIKFNISYIPNILHKELYNDNLTGYIYTLNHQII